MKKIINKIRYYFLITRGFFCRHRFFYEWGVSGVDRHGLYCVKCTMRIQGIVGRELRLFTYEKPPKEEMNEDGTKWMNPRRIRGAK